MASGRSRNNVIEMPKTASLISSEPLKPLRVLVIEDDALIAMLYVELVEEMGHVVCAIEGTEADAVAGAARYKPDLMIVDAGLRDGSGIAAVTEILRGGFIPHVFVTGDARAVQTVRPDAVILQKPFRDPELAQAVRRALNATSTS